MTWNPGDLTWTCHVCKDERPDDKISVYTERYLYRGIEVATNVRYCNDRPLCISGAPGTAERMRLGR